MNQLALVNGYRKFLDSFVWDIYLTVTFRRSTSTQMALEAFKYFFKHLNAFEQEFFKKFIRCIVFFEKQGYRDGVHIHCLIQGIDQDSVNLLEEECRKFFGESLAERYNYDLPEKASGYLARKCVGISLEHWDYLKINSKFRSKK